MTSSTVQPTVHPTSLRRSVANTLKGSLGNLVEWYDVYVYSTFAIYFESQFFNTADKNSDVYVWATFAITFLMRPFGSWFFGRLADRAGRRAALTLSVSVMAACSFVIALTPTRETIGVGAAIILILARIVQGFATGGEYGTSATYMSELAVAKHRGFLSSFQYVTLVGGQVLSQLVLLPMVIFADKAWITSWGWRIAFLIGGFGALVVLWLRRTMDESLEESTLADVRSGKAKTNGSMGELFGRYWKELLVCFLVTMGGTVAFYTYTVNAPKIVQTTFAGKDVVTGTILNLIALTILMLLQPLGGWLSDKYGRKTLLVFFGVGGTIYTYFLMTMLPKQHNPYSAFLVLIIGFVVLTGYTSINAVVKASMFPAHIRALGVGFGYALANSCFGGTAPLLYSWAKNNHQVTAFIIYVSVLIFISLLVYVVMLRNRGHNWIDHPEEMEERRSEHGRTEFPIAV